jgi:hypothetical protein
MSDRWWIQTAERHYGMFLFLLLQKFSEFHISPASAAVV